MLQDFTVAVLRTKPPDLYKFAAEYFGKAYTEKSGRVLSPDSTRKSKDAGPASSGSKASSKTASDMSSRDTSPGRMILPNIGTCKDHRTCSLSMGHCNRTAYSTDGQDRTALSFVLF